MGAGHAEGVASTALTGTERRCKALPFGFLRSSSLLRLLKVPGFRTKLLKMTFLRTCSWCPVVVGDQVARTGMETSKLYRKCTLGVIDNFRFVLNSPSHFLFFLD